MLIAIDEGTETSAVLCYQATEYVPASVAKTAVRNWADTSETQDSPPLHWIAAHSREAARPGGAGGGGAESRVLRPPAGRPHKDRRMTEGGGSAPRAPSAPPG